MPKYIHSEFDPHRPNVSYADYSDPLAPKGHRHTRIIARYSGQYPGQKLGDFKTQRLAIAIHTYEPGADHGAHYHHNEEQLFYVISGEASARIGDEQGVIGPGGAALIPPGVEHDFHNSGEDPLVMAVVSSVV